MNSSPVSAFSALDLVRLLFGVLITAAGFVACLLYLVRLSRRENSLFYFGLAAVLYGARLFIQGANNYMQQPWERIPLVISLVVANSSCFVLAGGNSIAFLETGILRRGRTVWRG